MTCRPCLRLRAVRARAFMRWPGTCSVRGSVVAERIIETLKCLLLGDQDGDEQGREKSHLLARLLAGRWFDSTDRLVRRQVEFRELVDRQRTNLALERGFGNRAHLEGQRHGLGGQALF
jgi:hypothetical protein